jgi:predicted lipoprotein
MQRHIGLYVLLFTGILTACDSHSSSSKYPKGKAPSPTGIDGTAQPDPKTDNPDATRPDGSLTDGASSSDPSPDNVPLDPEATADGDSAAPTPVVISKPAELKNGLRVSRATLLNDLGNGIAKKTVEFEQAVADLQASSVAYCTQKALNPTAKIKAQNAWTTVMLRWEQFELFQIGPLTENAKTLKYSIYGWPAAAALCNIDGEAVSAFTNPDYQLPTQLNRKGLQAVEYLLFEKDLATSCSKSNAIYESWNALTPEKRELARCAYLMPLTQELLTHATTLKNSWGQAGNNVLSQAVGNEDLEQAAIQSLFENLFYLDVEFKNSKLAAAAGHEKKYCAKSPAPCLDKEELRYSQLSREAMSANIAAFSDLMYGFADANNERWGGIAALVRDRGSETLALRSETYTQSLAHIFGDNPASLPELIKEQAKENCEASQNSTLCKLRALLKQIASDLKNEYISILQVKVPVAPAGDND